MEAGHCDCKGNREEADSTGQRGSDSDDTRYADEKAATSRNRNGAAAAGEAIRGPE